MDKNSPDDIAMLCSRAQLERSEYRTFGERSNDKAKIPETARASAPSTDQASKFLHRPAVFPVDRKRSAASSHGTRRALRSLQAAGREEHAVRARRQCPFVISVLPASGGAGATTASATLARGFSQAGENILLIDGQAESTLPIYFGGRANSRATGCYRLGASPESGDVHLLSAHPEDGTATAAAEMEWLDRKLTENLWDVDRAIIDTWPTLRAAALSPSLRSSVCVVVAVPDLNCVIGVQRLVNLLPTASLEIQPVLVLNKFDGAVSLHREIYSALLSQFAGEFKYFRISRGEEPTEALAEGLTINDFSPESTVAQDWKAVQAHLRQLETRTNHSEKGAAIPSRTLFATHSRKA